MTLKSVARILGKAMILTLPVVAVFGVVLYAVNATLESRNRDLLGQSETRQLEIQTVLVHNLLEKAASDIRFLASSSAVRAWADNPTPETLSRVEQDLRKTAAHKPLYYQLRLLSTQGMEMVRVQAKLPGMITSARESELQDKSRRTYFTDSLALSIGEIYVSRFDLNVENGAIERPFRPTIRIATPVFDTLGRKSGVLVLNLYGNMIREAMIASDKGFGEWQFLMADQSGYWLVGPTFEDEWGFQIPSRATRTLEGKYPRAWEAIRDRESGRLYTDKGLFLFSSINPEQSLGVSGAFFGAKKTKTSSDGIRWIFLAHLPQTRVAEYLQIKSASVFIAFGLCCLVILGYGLILAQVHERLKAARKKESNQAQALGETVDRMQYLIEINERNIQQVNESNARLESVLRAASRVSIIATDTEGVITLFNKGAETLLGYTSEEMVGKQTPVIIHSLDEIVARGHELTQELGYEVSGFDVFVEIARQGGFESREWTYIRKDGSLLTVELVATAISNVVDGIIGFLGIAVDVTERNQARQALEESRARIKSIVDAAVDGIFSINTDGVITSANTAGAAIFGYEPDEIIGEKVNMLMDEPHRSIHDQYLERYLTTGEARVIGVGGREVPGRHRDGRTIPLELGISEVKMESGHFFTGILRNITKRKAAEAELHAANLALKAKQQALNDDLSAAAHIQRGLLPQRAPNARGFTMDWLFEPSAHIGGDVFNMVPLPGGKIGLYLIDVSGHGPAAAMVTVSMSQVMQAGSDFVQENDVALAPDEVLRRLDKAFPLERFDRYCTMFYMIFDPEAREICSAGAGHPPPLLGHPGKPIQRLDAGGTVIGMGEPVPFASECIQVRAGDMLLLYTDGCTEHTNTAGQQFGVTRLEQALSERLHLEPDTLVDEIREELDRFGSGSKPEDDISLVCLKFKDE